MHYDVSRRASQCQELREPALENTGCRAPPAGVKQSNRLPRSGQIHGNTVGHRDQQQDSCLSGQMAVELLDDDPPGAAGVPPDNGPVDLDDWVYPYFHSEGTQNTFAIRDDSLDALIVSQRTELNEDARREIGFQIQRQVLDQNYGVNFVSERLVALSWPYVRDFPLDVADGYQRNMASAWIDKSDPTYTGF